MTQVPDLTHNVLLKEIRLNDNKITQIPETLRKCNAIEIMDFGNNGLANWSDIAALGSLQKLHNLNLKGNPLAKKKDYLEKILDLVPSLRILDGERFDPKFLTRKKKQRENVNIVEKKERMKRMKIQKEKKEKKARGEEEGDNDVEMKDVIPESKKRKLKGTDIAKIKSKRADTSATIEEPLLKKKKKSAATEEKDLFFLKPEDKPVVATKKIKTVKSVSKKAVVANDKAVAEGESKNVAPAPVIASVPGKAAAIPKAQTKAQTGVVGVVDKTKKILKSGSKKTTDIVAALETESTKKEDTNTGTGLDVGGWD